MTRRWPSLFRLQSTAVAVSAAIILSAPAIVPFALHLFEHAVPLGLSHVRNGGSTVPFWLAKLTAEAALQCAVPTWLAIGVAVATMFAGHVTWLGRAALALLVACAYVSMTGITAIMHSCWGEAPHYPWCA